ncbi:MFS transporter [Streptomyces sp. NBC_01387]|uniref:MFS transporter n=1 Tax=unclassified Streptomyces TaxID=2593676 RepID=UPI002E2FACD5|nr:MFS transporter [Streptomyces sp. NBC_01267]WSV56413.1 MFS transporter [Streptomyces sp. NBC_01014]
MSSRSRATWPLIAVFTAGYLASYLLPTVVGRLVSGLGLSPAQAGLVGSVLLLCSAGAGFTLGSRVERIGPQRLARAGLLLAVAGYGAAAATTYLPLVVTGVAVGGFGSGTAMAVASVGIAGLRDPHRASSTGLLAVSATAGALYLVLPQLGGGHRMPFAAVALVAALVWPATGRLGGACQEAPSPEAGRSRIPRLRSGTVLAGAMVCWSMAQNSLWGVSSRIGQEQAGLSEVTVGTVLAVSLAAGLVGISAASALGSKLGRALPIGAGTVIISGCIALSSSAGGINSFASGEILWNTFYPVVLSYLIGLAASLDPRGRWAVLVGSASSLGVACGPIAGSLLSAHTGFPVMGLVLAALLLLLAVPLTAVALHTSGRPLVPGSVRRRGGAPAALVAGRTGGLAAAVPELGAPELTVAEISVEPLPRRKYRFSTGHQPKSKSASKSYASTSAK